MNVAYSALMSATSLILCLVCCPNDLRADMRDESDLDARIDEVRKGDFTVRFSGVNGGPLGNADVSYVLTRHDFPFGTCLSTKMFRLPDGNLDREKYLDTVVKHFNYAVHENALKWQAMEREPGQFDDETAMMIWRWCRDHDIEMRGHCIFWGATPVIQPWVKALSKDELGAAMKARAERVLKLFDGKIGEFDLNNEMLHGDYYATVLGLRTGAPYFKFCKEIAPNATFYVNDYSVLNGRHTAKYVAHIRDLIQAGAEVGGIGCQGHFRGSVPSNEVLWKSLDGLARFNLPIKITEFDVDSADEEQQARDLGRFYRVCFAHPGVAGILMWGFWEVAHWRPNAALWRKDWSIKPAGKAYVRLLTEEWSTGGEGRTDGHGELHFRGFFGTYRFNINGRTFTARLTRDSPEARFTVSSQQPSEAPTAPPLSVRPHRNAPRSLYHAADIQGAWMEKPVTLRFPEILRTDFGIMFLDHIRADMPTKTDPRVLLKEWRQHQDGSLSFEWNLPDDVTAGGRLFPHSDEVDLEFWLVNRNDKPTQVHTQFCLVMHGSPFEDRELARSYVHINGEWRCMRDVDRGQGKWQLCHYPLVGGPSLAWAKDNPDGWGASADRADIGMLAVRTKDGRHVIGIAWPDPQSLLSNAFIPCIHADPRWPTCPPGGTVRLRGKLYLIEATLEELYSRWRCDFGTLAAR